MNKMTAGTAVVFLKLGATGHVHANDFVGWCLNDGGCIGSIPITERGFTLCEHNCTMKNPVSVRGMNGTLFDVACKGDSGSFEHRMLFMRYTDHKGNARGLALSPNGPRELKRCE